MLVVIFLLSTAGIDVDAHYCGSTLVETSLMGSLTHKVQKGDEMACCKMHKKCPMCKTVVHSFIIKAQYLFSQILQVHSYLFVLPFLLASLFIKLLPTLVLGAFFVVEFFYYSKFHDSYFISLGGFRAPPFAIAL